MSTLFKKDLANRYQASKIESAHVVLYKACQVYQDKPNELKCMYFLISVLHLSFVAFLILHLNT